MIDRLSNIDVLEAPGNEKGKLAPIFNSAQKQFQDPPNLRCVDFNLKPLAARQRSPHVPDPCASVAAEALAVHRKYGCLALAPFST